ncbi:MAG: winged helix-turn-helix transcriptional regulator, partial [bacterium]|nr:winged helix-turn-helix transcriptional regulator [bacterium]
MTMSKPDRSTVRFGVFEVDFAAAELRKRGRKVKLEAQPFQVLCVLIRRPGELVTREELQQQLWPADTFVEFDHSLNTAVKKIRQALDDSPRNPKYIETAPRQGYRFIGAVDSPGEETPSRRWNPVSVALVIVVAGIAAATGCTS